MKPVKTHPTDPWPVIEYAREWASQTEERKYVIITAYAFVAQASCPPSNKSHWMVLPDGECFAYTSVNLEGSYNYVRLPE